MSFGFGVGDIINVSKLCWTMYQACSAGRKGAPAVMADLARELWSFSTALDQLAAAASKEGSMFKSQEVRQMTGVMIQNCRASLQELDSLLRKYGIILEPTPLLSRGSQWRRRLRISAKKIQWSFEESKIESFRSRVGSHVRAVNLHLDVINGGTLRNIEAQLTGLKDAIVELQGSVIRDSPASLETKVSQVSVSVAVVGAKFENRTPAALKESNPSMLEEQNSKEACQFWYALLTEFGSITRSQFSKPSFLHRAIRNRLSTDCDQYDDSFGEQLLASSTPDSRLKIDAAAISGLVLDDTCESQMRIAVSWTMNELKRIISPGPEFRRMPPKVLPQIPLLICGMLDECLETFKNISAHQHIQKTCSEAGKWLGLYPKELLNPEPQLSSLRTKILKDSSRFWKILKDPVVGGGVTEEVAKLPLDSFSESFYRELSASSTTGDLNQLREWLKPVEEVQEELAFQTTRQWPNTCQWIFSKDSYRDWILGVQPSLLWCHGRPGAGKSVLANFLAQRFLEAGEICAYFPFRYNNEALRHAHQLVRTIAYQLAEQDVDIRQRLLDLNAGDLDIESARLGYMWQKLFFNGIFRLESTEPMYWVIDAIDEAEAVDLHPILALISDLQYSAIPVKVIIFSRYTREIAARILALPLAVSELLPEDTSQDIYRYTSERLRVLPITLEGERYTELLETIVGKANGTFLWVVKLIDALEQEDTVAGIKAAIDNSFKNLTQLYDEIILRMSQMQERQKRMAKMILEWTSCAARPMFTEELAAVLKVSFGELINIKSTLRNLCGQLLGIDGLDRVQAIHMTVHEYLKNDAKDWLRIDPTACNDTIADFCLAVLSAGDIASDGNSQGKGTIEVSNSDVFWEYASLYWFVHICRLPASEERITRVNTFLESSGGVFWIKCLTSSTRLDRFLSAIQSLEAWVNTGPGPGTILSLEKLRYLAARLGFTCDRYSGDLVDNRRHGFGICKYASGDEYTGEWKGDVREGKGTCTFNSGNVYEGIWANDEFHGLGRLSCPDGNVYDGEWAFGRRDGFGTMRWTWTERFQYSGGWKRDRFHGEGTMIYLFGTTYNGFWANGHEHGYGKIRYWNGDSYEGQFEDGCEIGDIGRVEKSFFTTTYNDPDKSTATVHYTTGARYEGEVNDEGLPHGEGVFYATTGVTLSGPFSNGRAEGHACVQRPNGGMMTGFWKNLVAHGHFTDVNDAPDGGIFAGELEDAAREGQGILKSAFKYDYEGNFHRNEMHGFGIRRYHNGDVYEGYSQDGWMEGSGTMRYADGWVYKGDWDKDRKHGSNGTLTLPGWGSFIGDWRNGQLGKNGVLNLEEGVNSLSQLPWNG